MDDLRRLSNRFFFLYFGYNFMPYNIQQNAPCHSPRRANARAIPAVNAARQHRNSRREWFVTVWHSRQLNQNYVGSRCGLNECLLVRCVFAWTCESILWMNGNDHRMDDSCSKASIHVTCLSDGTHCIVTFFRPNDSSVFDGWRLPFTNRFGNDTFVDKIPPHESPLVR